VDRISEAMIVEHIREHIAGDTPVVLIAEGLEEEVMVLPDGTDASEAKYRIIVDPIDGTRGLMYQKRSAWILTGVAPNKGPNTGLHDIELALQTELPIVKQHLSDQLWVVGDGPVECERLNRLTGETLPLTLSPSDEPTIAQGFVALARFFPGVRDELAAVEEQVIRGALGPAPEGKAHCFEDQYIATGGQLYEIMAGHDRFIADLRPLTHHLLHAIGMPRSLCAHPYDLCTELIARRMGIVVTDEHGQPLRHPLNTTDDVSWIGYANEAIREQIEPLLLQALKDRQLMPA